MYDHTRSVRAVLARLIILAFCALAWGSHCLATSAKVEVKVASANDELKAQLGQFFIFGLNGPSLDDRTRKHLLETRATAFILFRRNLINNKQVTELTADLHRLSYQMSGQPALIGLDQEGGKVVRIPFSPELPSPYAMGQSRDPQLVEDLSFQLGRALRQLGFNVNFAPVLDLGHDTQYSFLGQRAFSADPVWASDVGTAFARGQIRAGVLPVAKHFPGIGPVPNDPHLSLVRRSVSMEELRTRDLVPFENFARLPVSGMMISHLIYPKIDPSDAPGTFSKVIVQDLLQKQLNYTGLVITDDLMMAGAQASNNFQADIVKAFEAGADLMMITWSEQRQKQAINALWNAVQSGKISRETISTRLQKIDAIRKKVRMNRLPRALDPQQLLVYNFKPYEVLIDRLFKKSLVEADRAVTQFNSKNLLILKTHAPLLGSLSGTEEIRQGSATQIIQSLKNPNENSVWVLFVRNKKEADFAASVPDQLRQKVLMINLWRPDLKVGSFPHRLGLFMSHPKADSLLAEWINGKLLRSLALPLREPAHFGYYPTPRLPKIRSTDALQAASEVPDPLSHSLRSQ